MKWTVVMADPAGNRTAIVRSGVPKGERAKVASAILADPVLKAEQVGFETRPLYGGSLGRLEMAGGEFCGNAARSFGYLLCSEKGIDHCKIEMSGTREQLEVICDPDRETSAAQMPMPEKLEMAGEDPKALYPLVVMRGITHMLCIDREFDEAFWGLADQLLTPSGVYRPDLVRVLIEEKARGTHYLRAAQLVRDHMSDERLALGSEGREAAASWPQVVRALFVYAEEFTDCGTILQDSVMQSLGAAFEADFKKLSDKFAL